MIIITFLILYFITYSRDIDVGPWYNVVVIAKRTSVINGLWTITLWLKTQNCYLITESKTKSAGFLKSEHFANQCNKTVTWNEYLIGRIESHFALSHVLSLQLFDISNSIKCVYPSKSTFMSLFGDMSVLIQWNVF